MEKFAKYYLWTETLILLAIFLAGIYDASFWLFGMLFGGVELMVVGLVVSLLWRRSRRRLGTNIENLSLSVNLHIVVLSIFVLFILAIVSGGINFMM